MNPSVPQRVIDEAMERDPASAAAEFGAKFRSDIESFVSREATEAVLSFGVRERAPVAGVNYVAFTDCAGGGSGGDSFTIATAHKQNDVAVIDALREVRPPFSPEGVIDDFAAFLKRYHITKVTGDRWAGEFPREQFRKRGVEYEVSPKPKSDLYRDLLPAINSKQVDLLDNDRLFNQLIGLERRTARGGRDSIDHAPGSHDDLY